MIHSSYSSVEEYWRSRALEQEQEKPKPKLKASIPVALLLAFIITGLSLYGFYQIYEFGVIQNCMSQEVETTK